MKVKEIARLIPDRITLYKQAPDGMDYINLYKGYTSGIPSSMADMEIITIGAAKKGIVDIQVAKPKLDVDGIRAKMNKKNFMETCF